MDCNSSPQWGKQDTSSQPAQSYGWTVEDAGDVDGDGLTDVVVSDPFYNAAAGGSENGLVEVVSPANFLVAGAISSRVGPSLHNLGYQLANVGDINGVGSEEIAASTNGSRISAVLADQDWILNVSSPFATIVSVATEPTASNNNILTDGFLSLALTVIQDIDGDGLGELVCRCS